MPLLQYILNHINSHYIAHTYGNSIADSDYTKYATETTSERMKTVTIKRQ